MIIYRGKEKEGDRESINPPFSPHETKRDGESTTAVALGGGPKALTATRQDPLPSWIF